MSILMPFLSIVLTLVFVEIDLVFTQLEQDLDELNQFRKRMKGTNWKIQASELASKFKEILKSSTSLSEAMSIESYQGSILDYPTPEENKKLKILELLWNEYYECLKSQYDSIGLDRVLSPQAIMVFEGTNIRLNCDLCMSPDDIRETVKWYFSPTMDKSGATEIDEDLNIVISKYDNTLHILHIGKSNSGLYQCRFKNSQSTVYFVHVVDEEPIRLVRPSTARKNHSLHPQEKNGITVWNDWNEWSKCSQCGKVGKKIRTGYCMVTLSENLNIIGEGRVIGEDQNTSTLAPSIGTGNFMQPKNVTASGIIFEPKNVTKPNNIAEPKNVTEPNKVKESTDTQPNIAEPNDTTKLSNVTESNIATRWNNFTEPITTTELTNVTVLNNITESTSVPKLNSTPEPSNVTETENTEEPKNFTKSQLSKESYYDQALTRKVRHNIEQTDFQNKLKRVFGTHQNHLKMKNRRKPLTMHFKMKLNKEPIHLENNDTKFQKELERVFDIKQKNLQNFATKKRKVFIVDELRRDRFARFDYEFKKTLGELERVFDEEQGNTNYYYKKLVHSNVWNNHRVKKKSMQERKHGSDFFQLWTRPAHGSPMKNRDLTMLRLFDGGIPCRSQLLPKSIQKMPEVASRATEVMVAYCKEPCVESIIFQVYDTKGKIIEEVNNTAGLYSTLQDLPNFPLTVVRRTLTVKASYKNLKLICPATIAEDTPVEWQIKSKPICTTLMEKETHGRVIIDLFDRIVFTSLNDSDARTYSCWQNKELVGVVTLIIDHKLPYKINRQFMILGVVPVVVTFGICLHRVFKLRNRGRT